MLCAGGPGRRADPDAKRQELTDKACRSDLCAVVCTCCAAAMGSKKFEYPIGKKLRLWPGNEDSGANLKVE